MCMCMYRYMSPNVIHAAKEVMQAKALLPKQDQDQIGSI